MAKPLSITVAGAGILGVWQALTLARRGHAVRLLDACPTPFAESASRYAGAMLAPDCEGESAPAIVRDLGHRGLALWRETYRDLTINGSLVIAAARDRSELSRFARLTSGHTELEGDRIAALEPDLKDRFDRALYFPNEAHMTVPDARDALFAAMKEAGVRLDLGTPWTGERPQGGLVIDCRGFAASPALATLRAVRGERLLIRSSDVALSRPVRLLHPRHPIYVVPWREERYIIGATVLESSDAGPMTVRSALELLGTAYALAPAFAEAEILDMGAGLRPAFPDNVPRAVLAEEGMIRVNGAYRHGFLLAPVLAEAVADALDNEPQKDRAPHPLIVNMLPVASPSAAGYGPASK